MGKEIPTLFFSLVLNSLAYVHAVRLAEILMQGHVELAHKKTVSLIDAVYTVC